MGGVAVSKTKKFSVGDALVRFGKVYKVCDVKEKQRKDLKQRIIYFKPVFINRQNDTLVCSIPESNIDVANIRAPLSKSEIEGLLSELGHPEVEEMSFKRYSAEKKLDENKAEEIIKILKNLWLEMQNDEQSFSPSKKSLYFAARRRLAQEIAFVKSLELEDAEQLIDDQLLSAGQMRFIAD